MLAARGRAVPCALFGGALVIGGALSGCSSHASSTSTTAHTTSSTTTTPSTTTKSSASTSTPTTALSTSSTCAASVLDMRVEGSQGAAGTVELTVSMRNTAAATCTLHGYPGAQLLDATGTELMTQVVRGGNYSFTDFAATTVSLASGSSAYFNLAYSDVPSGNETSCPTAAHLEVTPPNAVDHGTVPIQAQVCNGGTVTVSPVFGSGSANTQTTAPAQA